MGHRKNVKNAEMQGIKAYRTQNKWVLTSTQKVDTNYTYTKYK